MKSIASVAYIEICRVCRVHHLHSILIGLGAFLMMHMQNPMHLLHLEIAIYCGASQHQEARRHGAPRPLRRFHRRPGRWCIADLCQLGRRRGNGSAGGGRQSGLGGWEDGKPTMVSSRNHYREWWSLMDFPWLETGSRTCFVFCFGVFEVTTFSVGRLGRH